jgi:hypothetical protein
MKLLILAKAKYSYVTPYPLVLELSLIGKLRRYKSPDIDEILAEPNQGSSETSRPRSVVSFCLKYRRICLSSESILLLYPYTVRMIQLTVVIIQ